GPRQSRHEMPDSDPGRAKEPQAPAATADRRRELQVHAQLAHRGRAHVDELAARGLRRVETRKDYRRGSPRCPSIGTRFKMRVSPASSAAFAAYTTVSIGPKVIVWFGARAFRSGPLDREMLLGEHPRRLGVAPPERCLAQGDAVNKIARDPDGLPRRYVGAR